jgi:hypothetical protein
MCGSTMAQCRSHIGHGRRLQHPCGIQVYTLGTNEASDKLPTEYAVTFPHVHAVPGLLVLDPDEKL